MIVKLWSSKKNEIIVFFVLMLLSLIPVVYTWGRLPIGGDTFIPINSDGLQKYLYQWISLRNGQYFSINYFPFYLFYKICELFKLNLYQISSALLFSLSLVSGLGIYRLVKLFFPDKKYYFYLLPIIFYLFSPALLVGWVFGYVYSFAPWFIYFIFKVIKSRRSEVKDMIFMSFLLFFLSADLPNPKYIFYLAVISLVAILSALFLRLVDFKFLLNNLGKLVLFFLLSAYLFLPLFYFASNYSTESYDVHIKTWYVDTGPMMDYGSATMAKMVRLHQDNINLEVSRGIEYNSNLVVGILSYLPIVLIIIGLLIIKNRYYLIFTLLSVCLLFFAVGSNKPFGFVYEFFVSNFKHLAFLRTTAGAVFFLSIFYSVLLAFILDRLATKSKIIYPLILLSILIVGYPFLNGDYYKNRKIVNPYTDGMQYGQRIPQDYFDVKKDIDAIKRDMRIVYSIPDLSYINTTWGFFGYPIYNYVYNSNNIGFKTVFSNLANHNVGLIYNDKSLMDNPWLDKTPYDSQSEPLTQKGFIELRKVKEEYFLPHFYIPQNIIYSNGGIESLVDMVNFGDWKIRSAIYLQSSKLKAQSSKLEIDLADKFFIKGELEDKVSEEELGVVVKPEKISFPQAQQKPGSVIYPLALTVEKFNKWKVRKDPEKSFENYLLYGDKRIAELEKFGVKDVNGLTDYLLTNYEKEMIGAIKETEKQGNKEIKEIEKLRAYLEMHRRKIEQTNLDEEIKDKIRDVFDDLEGKIAELEPKRDFSRLVYKFDVPKEGEYEIYVRDIDDIRNQILDIGNQTLDAEGERDNASSATVSGEISNIQSPVSSIQKNNWKLLETKYFPEGEQELVLPFSGVSENLIDENLKIQNYWPDAIYKISFDYKASKGGGFFVAEGKGGETARTDLFPTGEKFKHFEMFFKSSSGVADASIHLSISVAEEKNLKVERIYQPEMMLKSIKEIKEINELTDYGKTVPKITFVKINPTKYKIKFEGAREPYTLVFSESFHKGWKLYINGLTDSKINGLERYRETVASYFDGEIKEGTHKNIFLDGKTFETWGKEPLAEDRHLLVNGYANSWYIKPEDTGGKEDYEIIIEFAPQKLFYIGLGISLLALVGCLGYLGVKKIKKISRA